MSKKTRFPISYNEMKKNNVLTTYEKENTTMENENKKPAKKYNRGVVSVARWDNDKEGNVFSSFTANKSYVVKDSSPPDWKHTNNFNRDDIPKLISALQEAYDESFKKEDAAVV